MGIVYHSYVRARSPADCSIRKAKGATRRTDIGLEAQESNARRTARGVLQHPAGASLSNYLFKGRAQHIGIQFGFFRQ
jgi:hypothetical protein